MALAQTYELHICVLADYAHGLPLVSGICKCLIFFIFQILKFISLLLSQILIFFCPSGVIILVFFNSDVILFLLLFALEECLFIFALLLICNGLVSLASVLDEQ